MSLLGFLEFVVAPAALVGAGGIIIFLSMKKEINPLDKISHDFSQVIEHSNTIVSDPQSIDDDVFPESGDQNSTFDYSMVMQQDQPGTGNDVEVDNTNVEFDPVVVEKKQPSTFSFQTDNGSSTDTIDITPFDSTVLESDGWEQQGGIRLMDKNSNVFIVTRWEAPGTEDLERKPCRYSVEKQTDNNTDQDSKRQKEMMRFFRTEYEQYCDTSSTKGIIANWK